MWARPCGNASGGGGGRGLEEVACAAAAGVGVAVLGYGWVRLGDEVGGRHFGWFVLFVCGVFLERFVGLVGGVRTVGMYKLVRLGWRMCGALLGYKELLFCFLKGFV